MNPVREPFVPEHAIERDSEGLETSAGKSEQFSHECSDCKEMKRKFRWFRTHRDKVSHISMMHLADEALPQTQIGRMSDFRDRGEKRHSNRWHKQAQMSTESIPEEICWSKPENAITLVPLVSKIFGREYETLTPAQRREFGYKKRQWLK